MLMSESGNLIEQLAGTSMLVLLESVSMAGAAATGSTVTGTHSLVMVKDAYRQSWNTDRDGEARRKERLLDACFTDVSVFL